MIKVSKKAVIVDFSQIVSFENDFKCCEKTNLERSLRIFFKGRLDYIIVQVCCVWLAHEKNGYLSMDNCKIAA